MSRRRSLLACLALTACSAPAAPTPDAGADPVDIAMWPDFAWARRDAGPSPYPLDDVLRLNHVQAKGTHNSYHVEPPKVFSLDHRYTHAPLDVQLAQQGVRQFELDIHYRAGAGFEVFHLPVIDPVTTCRRFIDCMALVRAWSDAHPWHLPIVIWIEPKDDADTLDPELLPLADRWDEFDRTILAVWPRERVFTPDDLRGAHPDLPSAIADTGWPTLGKLRGKVLFALLDSDKQRAAYLGANKNLAGRVLFVDADTDADPFAAMFKIDDAMQQAARVTKLVKQGFIITSNVDSITATDDSNRARSTASIAAGAHFLSSDLPAPVPGATYSLSLPGGTPAVCNAVFPAANCKPSDIETGYVP